MNIETLKAEIEKREEARLKSKMSQYKPNNCVASGLGECLRERYHSIVDYDKKELAGTWLQARFEEGNEQERRLLIKLLTLGIEVVEGQKRFEVKDRTGRVILTGRIEGKIKYEGKYYPFEIKSMNPNIYDGINSLEDMQKYGHTARYPKQLMSYMFSENVDEGFFLLTDCLGHFKIIPIKLDYEMMEKEMQACELVMVAVEKKLPPAHHKDTALCRKCWAAKTCCFPALDFGEGVTIVDDAELEIDLKERDKLQEAAKAYEKLDKKVKERLKIIPHAVCGNFESVAKTTPTNYKAQEAKVVNVTKVSISKIESDITTEIKDA